MLYYYKMSNIASITRPPPSGQAHDHAPVPGGRNRDAAPDHGHGHDHDHAHDHAHPHPAGTGLAGAARPSFSLLPLSAAARMGGAALIVAGLWIAVIWAVR